MNSDDPNVTAYALGELETQVQASATKAIAGSPEVAAEAWEIRAFAARLRRDLQTEPAAKMRPEQRSRVMAEVDRAAALIEAERNWWRGWVPTAIAASAALMIGGSLFVQSQQFAQWWAKRTSWDINLLWAEDSSTQGQDSIIPPVDPSIQDRPIYRFAPTAPQLPLPGQLNLPPPPKSTARLVQPPPLHLEQTPGPTVDPASIPMTGRPAVAERTERVRSRLGVKAPTASPTPGKSRERSE